MKNQNIPKKILYWYDNNKRVLPWRKQVSKKQKQYFTLVSEFMLQQTQVKTVIPYFNNFINKIPNLKKLSNISGIKLMKNWEGLGYYSRARNLKETAKKLFQNLMANYQTLLKNLKHFQELATIHLEQSWQLYLINPSFLWMVMLKEY